MTLFEKLKETLNKSIKPQPEFDPATLDNPMALKIKWTPAKAGGTNICTHGLVEISPTRVAFKARKIAIFFPGIFMAIGLFAAVVMSVQGLRKDMKLLYMGLPIGLIFFFIGLFILRSWLASRVFDLDLGYYWKGKIEPVEDDAQNEAIKERCLLSEIYAIQLLQEYCRTQSSNGGGSSYYSYELNLILSSGERINVVDHGKISLIRSDAEKLSKFLLDAPVWDATFK